jgi:hypothetical protein
MGSRGRRQSLSPTPSRRASSSHSIERDRLSSYSKASATSSGEDDLDSMQSLPVAYSTSPAVKKSLSMMKTRTIASSKKPSTTFSTSSVPKRSFDSAVWLMVSIVLFSVMMIDYLHLTEIVPEPLVSNW